MCCESLPREKFHWEVMICVNTFHSHCKIWNLTQARISTHENVRWRRKHDFGVPNNCIDDFRRRDSNAPTTRSFLLLQLCATETCPRKISLNDLVPLNDLARNDHSHVLYVVRDFVPLLRVVLFPYSRIYIPKLHSTHLDARPYRNYKRYTV